MKRSFFVLMISFYCCFSFAQSGKIKVYFTKPVNTTYSTGTNAVQLFKSMDDTLVAYINRAKRTLDIAIYNYTYASTIADIAGAINNAYNRGVRVRIIKDGSTGNTGLNTINSNIQILASPQGSNYNIMHNKFVIIDAKTVNDAIVWTGSTNWSSNQFNSDANNTLIIQDQPLAFAFRTEFEEMWGDTGMNPGVANSRFGQYKADNTPHQFTVDGKQVELYFSPSDNMNTNIQNTINTANNDLEFCLLQFTRTDLANTIAAKVSGGVSGKGVVDPTSLLAGQAAFDILVAAMDSTNMLVDNQSSSSMHSKYLIVDQSNALSDPLVLTGSHNWTTSAQTVNDENTLIIHDSTIANIYYQEFMARFNESTVLGVNEVGDRAVLNVYPNPFESLIEIDAPIQQGKLEVFNVLGEQVFEKIIGGKCTVDLSFLETGLYSVRLITHSSIFIRSMIKK